jgi:thioredoxin reductase (NADPH)
VVIASGARYRRAAAPRLAEFEGRGIWYWASPLEAKLCDGEEVAIIGGGNSAGQAVVFLSSHASRVHMLIRGEGLAASMSRYLIDRIAATPSVVLHPNTEVSRLCGDAVGRLASISSRDRRTGHAVSERFWELHRVICSCFDWSVRYYVTLRIK